MDRATNEEELCEGSPLIYLKAVEDIGIDSYAFSLRGKEGSLSR